MVPPLHPPTGSPRGFFSDIYYGNLLKLLEVNWTTLWAPTLPHDPLPLEFLLSMWSTLSFQQFIHHSPVFCPHSGSHGSFHSGVSALLAMTPCICLLVSNLGTTYCPVSSPFMDWRRVVDFSVFLAFSLLGQCSDVHAHSHAKLDWTTFWKPRKFTIINILTMYFLHIFFLVFDVHFTRLK